MRADFYHDSVIIGSLAGRVKTPPAMALTARGARGSGQEVFAANLVGTSGLPARQDEEPLKGYVA